MTTDSDVKQKDETTLTAIILAAIILSDLAKVANPTQARAALVEALRMVDVVIQMKEAQKQAAKDAPQPLVMAPLDESVKH